MKKNEGLPKIKSLHKYVFEEGKFLGDTDFTGRRIL